MMIKALLAEYIGNNEKGEAQHQWVPVGVWDRVPNREQVLKCVAVHQCIEPSLVLEMVREDYQPQIGVEAQVSDWTIALIQEQ
jgi:hypothetical protein